MGWGGGGGGGGGRGSYPKGGQLTHPRILGVRRGGGQGGSLSEWRSCPVTAAVALFVGGIIIMLRKTNGGFLLMKWKRKE